MYNYMKLHIGCGCRCVLAEIIFLYTFCDSQYLIFSFSISVFFIKYILGQCKTILQLQKIKKKGKRKLMRGGI